MISPFTPTANDASLNYLSMIFGNVNGVISLNGQALGQSLTLLGTMFKTFNSIVLVVAILVLVYVTVVGVIATAHEGTFLGQKWNNIWVPLRLVIGFALLVPTGSGYCGIQILIMWVIIQGVGAADNLWNTALTYITVLGSPYAQGSVPNINLSATFSQIFQGLVCHETASLAYDNPADPGNPVGGYFCYKSSNPFCGSKPTFNSSQNTIPFGPTNGNVGRCGTLTLCNETTACSTPNSLACLACQAQHSAIGQVIQLLDGIAVQMANADYAYRQFFYNSNDITNNSGNQWILGYCAAQSTPIPKQQCCVKSSGFAALNSTCQGQTKDNTPLPAPDDSSSSGSIPTDASQAAVSTLYWPFWPQLGPNLGLSTDFIQTAVGYYTQQANTVLNNYVASQSSNPNNLNSSLQVASAQGWLFAGAFYYAMAQVNQGTYQAAAPTLTWTAGDFSTAEKFRSNYNAAAFLSGASTGTAQAAIPGAQGLQNAQSAINEASQTILNAFQDTLTGKGNPNPLIAIQHLGSVLIIVAETLFVVFFTVIIALGLVGGLDIFLLGTGVTNPLAVVSNIMAMVLMPLIYAVLGILVGLGGLLAVYTPLIPFIVFSFGALGWFISVIEAMLAGPLVALHVLVPSEQQGPLGKAESALPLLFNVFMRPALMIFGLISAMLLATVAVSMINTGFGIVYKALMGTTAVPGSYDPISFFMLM